MTGPFRSRRRPGTVWLVGAGPGDPELLTVRAERLLTRARVLAHDELVSAPILSLAARDAEIFSVGRRAHGIRHHDERIDPRVLEHALAGHDVVRLKAGDPFVFGRGGEEAEALTELQIPFVVVPGITAALAAASCTGIPLTHRDASASLTLVTAHAARGDGAARLPTHVPPEGTVVLYMGLTNLAASMQALIDGGRAANTPAAIVTSASRPEQRLVTGTLASLAAQAAEAGVTAPAVVLVGEVVERRVRSCTGAQAAREGLSSCYSAPW